MSRIYDVAIVGGGVAGSSLATVLARAGLSVVVIEREKQFRDRVRGEGIHPWGVAEIHRLGLTGLFEAAGANPLPIWQSYESRMPKEPIRWADVSIDGHPEMGVSHPRLQDAAIAAAGAAGATIIRPGRAIAYRTGAKPEVDLLHNGSVLTLRARLIAGADGRTSAVRKSAGRGAFEDPPHHRFGGALVKGLDLADDAAHEAAFSGGRAFVLPQGEGRARAYIVTATECNRDVQADRSGPIILGFLAELFPEGSWDGVTMAGPIAFFSNADVWAKSIADPNLVLIGDAAGANDPSTGHGLSLVFRDVRVLSDLLLGGDDWQAAIEEFASRRNHDFEVLRAHAHWFAIVTTEYGPEHDAQEERIGIARERDPSAGGFATIFARGPDGLVANENARRRFFGEM